MTVPATSPDPSPDIAVIILTYRQREMTRRVLETLEAQEGDSFHVLVRDNGSRDDTVVTLREAFPHVHFVAGRTNLGVAGGRNDAGRRAIDLWQPEFLLFLDNDMEVEPGFVTELAAPMRSDPRIAQTQAKLLYMSDRDRINDGGGCRIVWWKGETEAVGVNELDRGQYDTPGPCMACCGGAMMVRSSVFSELGGFDEAFNPFGPEDLDFSLRLLEAGYRNLYVPTAVAYHAVTHTFGAGYTEEYARNKVRNWFRLLHRHATPAQRLAFYAFGGPRSVLMILWREIRRGNASAATGAIAEAARNVLRRGSGRTGR